MTENASVLITGAAKRVGAHLAKELARQGYDIALHYHSSKEDAEEVKKAIAALGRRCELYAADLTKTKAAQPLIEAVIADFPGLSVLINNASVFEKRSFMDTDEGSLEQQLNVNFKLPFFLTQHFAKLCPKASHVVNMLDTEIRNSSVTHFAYLLSKKALGEFTKMAAADLGPHIQVNAICPGILMPCGKHDEAYIERFKKTLPLGENATMEQVTQTIMFLLNNSRITGELLFIDGGEHLLCV